MQQVPTVPKIPNPVPRQTYPAPVVPPLVKTQSVVPIVQKRTAAPIAPTAPTVVASPTTQSPQGGLLVKFVRGGKVVKTVAATPRTTTAPVINIVKETGLSILMKLLDVWNGTPEQAQQLSELQYTNGKYIIDADRRDIIMEIIGMLLHQKFNNVVKFLIDAPDPTYILWDQEAMDEGKTKVLREIAIQQAAEIGVKGVGKCRYCPSTELVFALKQLRSADEATSIFVRCVMCQKQWRQ